MEDSNHLKDRQRISYATMKIVTSAPFLYLVSGIVSLIFINDRHKARHIPAYIWTAVLSFLYWKIVAPIIENYLLFEKVKQIVRNHATQLSIERSRRIRKDAYGNVSEKGWEKEIEYFIDKTICRDLSAREKELLDYERLFQKTARLVDTVAREKNIHCETNLRFYEGMAGEDYEQLCMDILVKCGWDVSPTKKTGDQGVDLLAIKNNVRVAIQCKRYSKSIGNSAVQEVISGKLIYRAHYGVVVSNVPYTKAAKELSEAGNIKLLHHYHLLEDDFYCKP